jgi:hypothetical protein
MRMPVVTLEGAVNPDGTLALDQVVALPPGRVQITIVPIPELPANDPFWQRMEALWAGQRARGHLPRGVQEVEAERQMVRDEWDERMRRIEQIQAEAAQIRRGPRP